MDLQRERQRGEVVSTWHIFLDPETQISFKLPNRTSGFSKSEVGKANALNPTQIQLAN